MKALSEVRIPVPPDADEQVKRSANTNQHLLNKNFRQIEDAIRELQQSVKELLEESEA